MEIFIEFYGEKLKVDNILKGSAIKRYSSVWQKGEPEYAGSGKINKQSGVQVRVCDKETVREQIKEVRKFIEKYRNEIIKLRSLKGIDAAEIRFGLNWYEGKDVMKTSFFPNDFLLLCGKLKIDLKLCEYLTSDN